MNQPLRIHTSNRPTNSACQGLHPEATTAGSRARRDAPGWPALGGGLAICLILLTSAMSVPARPTPKWTVFEKTLESSRLYANPPQAVRLMATFVSPTGRTNRIHGYWDGGSRWGIRFCPDELGYWTYSTECSDTRNSGLHGQSGRFLCSVQSLRNVLNRHGKITVPPDSPIFRHADATPFLWTADGVWEGLRQSKRKDWNFYVTLRSRQNFNVAMWQAAPGLDDRGKSVLKGTNPLEIDAAFLRRLDEKITRLNQAGMVSAIAPWWELDVREDDLLPEDQVILLLRQMVGRWDAHHVAWIIAFEADADGRRAARWRRIGRSVFDQVSHSPVVLFSGSTHWALKEFVEESWVNAVAFRSGNDVSEEGNLWLARGPATTLWRQRPVRPVLDLLPAPEAGISRQGKPITTRQALRSSARSLFVAPPAGLCYESLAVAEWDQTVDTNTVALAGEELTEWHKSLYLPGAARVGAIRDVMERNEFHRLRPANGILLPQRDGGTPVPCSALATPDRERALIFVPEGATTTVRADAVEADRQGTFENLNTGKTVSATGRSVEGAIEYPTPGAGDWLLSLPAPTE